jgi:competence protein ComEC
MKPAATLWILAGLAWLSGLLLLQSCERLPEGGETMALWLAVAASLVGVRWWRWCLLPAALLLAFAQGAWRAETRLADTLPWAWEGRDIQLVGRVDSLPVRIQGQGGVLGWRFEFAVESASEEGRRLTLPSRLLLSIYGDAEAAPALRAGERWQWTARLKRAHGAVNPAGFDYELWMFDQGLRASGSVRPEGRQRLTKAPWWSIDNLRQQMRDALARAVPEASRFGVLAGLSLGDQAAIPSADWALYRRTGTAHLLSVSGSHITMFAWLAQAVVLRLWRRSAPLCRWMAAPRAALVLGSFAALAYALFSGFGVPAQRTVWMLVTLSALQLVGVRWPWALCLLTAAFVVTCVDPFAVSQPGFWLSFCAVALLMSGAGRGMLREQMVASIGLAPLGLLLFQQISVVGLIANLVAVPLVGFVLTPLSILGSVIPPLWSLGAWCSELLLLWLHWLDGLPLAVLYLPVAPAWAQAAGLLGAVLLVLPLPRRLRVCGLLLLVPLLWPAPWRPAAGEFELIAADVGQGTAVLIRTAGHDLLFDSGPQFAPDVDAGQRVLLPLLRALGSRRLDLLVLSHRDMDHVGGADSVMEGLPVAKLLSSLEASHPLLRGPVPHERCLAGQRWSWDGVRFEVLHPPPERYLQPAHSNTMSCLVRVIAANGRAALLTGDIEAPQERELVAAGVEMRSELLMAPHHGSKTSSSEELLNAVQPRLAVIQAGYRNRFGHPALPVLTRLQAHGVVPVESSTCGALRWRSDASAWQCEPDERRRYWLDVAPPAQDFGPWREEPAGEAER